MQKTKKNKIFELVNTDKNIAAHKIENGLGFFLCCSQDFGFKNA